ncbi:HAD family hydrolase [Streptomyces sp. NBC_01190]|uniref:HAD family hydrolase n=1 Tax=Streptomyces sp. NBC_01190 TaxID=2903767 RepID=UPI00386E8930|nr:HAD-IB family hydrolase [Streptomyces sp. NBC_01190]
MTVTTATATAATTATHRVPYLVFSDVDETLVNAKSMVEFLRFRLTRRYGEAEGTNRFLGIARELQAQAAAGTPRDEINRAYYRHYAGEDAAATERLGEEWFAERSARPDFFIGSTLASLSRHRAAGAGLVLVSGSFRPCLAPIARHVGAAYVLATTPLVRDGKYTGEVAEPMIGNGKRAAVLRLLAEHPTVDPRECYAFGDHPSDLPMLECVGNPRVVGDHPELVRHFRPSEPVAADGCGGLRSAAM